MVFTRSPFFRILFLLNLLVFAILAWPENGATLLFLWPWTWIFQLALGLTLLAAVAGYFFDGEQVFRPHSKFGPAVILLLVAFVTSCFLSKFSGRATLSLIVPVSALCLGYTTHCLVRNSERPENTAAILFQALGMIALLVYLRSLALWILTTVWGPESEIAATVNALAGYSFDTAGFWNEANPHPFGHPNYTAGFSLLTLPLVVSLSIMNSGRKRMFWGMVSILGLGVLLSSGSRAGTGGAAFALLGGAIFYLKGKTNTRRRLNLGIAGAIILAGLLVFAQPRLRSTIGDFMSGKGLQSGDHERLNLFVTGLQMGMEHPFLGNGPGTTPIYYPAFWNGSGNLSNSYQLHCMPLQVWADFGALALLAGAGLLFAFFYSWRKISLDPAYVERKNKLLLVIHGTGLGIVAYLVFSLTDYQLDIYFVSGMLAIYGGLFSALNQRALTQKKKAEFPNSQKFIKITTSLVLLILCAAFGWKQYGLLQARNGLRSASIAFHNNDGQAFLDTIDKSEKWASEEPYFYNYLGWLAAEARQRGQSLLPEKILFHTANDLWQRSLTLFENQEFCHYSLGWLHLDSNPEQAAFHFRRAANINPGKRGVYFGLALALKKQGMTAAAHNALALECLSQPQFATFSLWDSPNFKSVLPTVKSRLWKYYESMKSRKEVRAKHLQNLRETEALTRWWWGEPFDPEALTASPKSHVRWWGQILQDKEMGEPEFWDSLSMRAPIVLTYLAWKYPEDGGKFLQAAKFLALGQDLTENESDYLLSYLVQPGKSFPQLLLESKRETALPLNVYRNTRLAFGLMGHNLDGPNPGDFFIYEQNLLLKITQVWLFPQRGYLPGSQMRRFLEELPNN